MDASGLPCSLAALSSLQQLQTVCWESGNEKASLPFPGGPWLGQLGHLALSLRYLSDAASLQTLSGATQLEHLGVIGTHSTRLVPLDGQMKEASSFHNGSMLRAVAWAQHHPSLQLLALDCMSARVADAAAAAMQQRPGLRIRQCYRHVFFVACGYERDDGINVPTLLQ